MNPRIAILPEKKLIGKRLKMSLTDNKTFELWKSFIDERKKILNSTGVELYSIQIYEPSYFLNFNPKTEFEKIAAIEVTDFKTIPDTMETFILNSGLYAIFLHKGAASTGEKTFNYIFQTWLPGSDYLLDNRPHFEILGTKYKNDDPDSEEEICIPIKPKHK